jgi:hypothetical protein
MALADGSNSGRYSGHGNIPWDEIVKKIPKLDGLKDLFAPKPLTSEEKEVINKVARASVGDNPYESLGEEKWVEIWLEYNSPNLNDEQYSHLSVPLKKKYIALGMDLSSAQIMASEPEVLKYYANKKIETIKNKDLRSLNSSDIALLNSPIFKSIKKELKPKFTSQLGGDYKSNNITISYPNDNSAKYMALYNINDIFSVIAKQKGIMSLTIENREKNSTFNIDIPPTISELTELESLYFDNCVEKIPEEFGRLKNLEHLVLINNPKLTELPESLGFLPNLQFVNLNNSKNIRIPEWLSSNFTNFDGADLWIREDI